MTIARDAGGGWILARASGLADAGVLIKPTSDGMLIRTDDPLDAGRLGLERAPDSSSLVLARTAQDLHRALRVLHTLQKFPEPHLSARAEARLAAIPATERTREVRERIGQEVFREALMGFWGDRCALSGVHLPPALLRASHAKPWAKSSDHERLDPFNGLLLAVRYDALFDQGLIAFDDEGQLLASRDLTDSVREFVGLRAGMQLRYVLPGHLPYLRYHRECVARLVGAGSGPAACNVGY